MSIYDSNNLPTVEQLEDFLLNLQRGSVTGYETDLYAQELAKTILVYIQARVQSVKPNP